MKATTEAIRIILTILGAGILHVLPVLCIGVIASNPSEATTACAVGILCATTLGLGYWHGREVA